MFPRGVGSWRGVAVIAGVVIGLAAIGVGAVFAYRALNKPVGPLSVATDVTSQGVKVDTNGDGKPDATIPNDAPADGAAAKPGGGGQPAASGGGTAGSPQGGTGGGSSGGGGGSSGGGSSSSCPLPAYPSASCTGVPAGTSLTVVNGDMTISAANTVIENKDIRGCVDVNASGVIIRKSKIAADCFYVVYRHSSSGTALLIEDSEVTCNNNNGTGIGDTGITVRRVNIHGCENGFDLDGDIIIQDSFIHDLTQTGSDPHTDGIQITPVGHNITIQHNTIYGFSGSINGTSAIIQPDAAITNIVIKENLVAGGAYTIYCRATGSYGSTFQLINNHFSTVYGPNVGEYGPWTDCEDESNVSGNVYHESGQPVPF